MKTKPRGPEIPARFPRWQLQLKKKHKSCFGSNSNSNLTPEDIL